MTTTQKYRQALLDIALYQRGNLDEVKQIARAALGERALEQGRQDLEEAQERGRRQFAPVERKGG